MKAEKAREFLRYYFPYHDSHNPEKQIENLEKDRVLYELQKLESDSEAYNSPETQKLIELGRYVKMALNKGCRILEVNKEDGLYNRVAISADELIQWGREQEAKNENTKNT